METIRVGQLVERLSKLDKHDRVYCGGAPVANGPEPVSLGGIADIDTKYEAARPALRDEIDLYKSRIDGLEAKIESIRDYLLEAIKLIEDGKIIAAHKVINDLTQA